MFLFPPTIILRHKKENLKKCSLKGLESRKEINFLTYPEAVIPDLSNYVVLTLGAPELSIDDADYGLFLIDGTWRYAAQMYDKLPKPHLFRPRSLPPFRTAYPRKQTDCPFPNEGLASIEALYVAYKLLGRNPEGLLDNYYWKEPFLHALRSPLTNSEK
jgi:pre-rRNA-processing protein TSR3